MTRHFLFVPSVIVYLFFIQTFAFSQEDWKARFLAEAPKAWQMVQEKFKNGCDVKSTYFERTSEGTYVPQKRMLRIRICGDYELVHAYSEDVSLKESISAVNEQYSFSLQKESGEESLGVDYVDLSPDVPRTNHQWRMKHLPQMAVLFAGILVEGEWLADFFGSDDVEVLSIEPVTPNKPDTDVVVTFRGNHHVDDYHIIGGGSFTLIPSQYWTIRSYKIQCRDDFSSIKKKMPAEESSEIEVKIDYQDFEGMPFPKNAYTTYNVNTKKGLEIRGSLSVNDLPTRGSTDTAEFFLKQYGFDELPGIGPQWWKFALLRWLCWSLGIVGIILIVVALKMKFRKHER